MTSLLARGPLVLYRMTPTTNPPTITSTGAAGGEWQTPLSHRWMSLPTIPSRKRAIPSTRLRYLRAYSECDARLSIQRMWLLKWGTLPSKRTNRWRKSLMKREFFKKRSQVWKRSWHACSPKGTASGVDSETRRSPRHVANPRAPGSDQVTDMYSSLGLASGPVCLQAGHGRSFVLT